MSRAASSLSLRGSAQALLRSSRALALRSCPPAVHAFRRFSSSAQMQRVERELARLEADSVARFEHTSRWINYAKTKMAAAANTAGDRAFKADLNVGRVSVRVALTVLGLTVGGSAAGLHAVRLTSDKASRDRIDAHAAAEIGKMRIGLDAALDEVLHPEERDRLAALAGLEAREKAAAATSIQQDAREKSIQARELALSKKLSKEEGQ